MKGLLLKDFYMMKRYCRSVLLICFVFIGVSTFSGENISFMVFFPAIMSGMIPVSLYAYDEREKWCSYCATLPCSRRLYVSGKYVITLLLSMAVLAATAVAQWINLSHFGPVNLTDYFSILIIIGLVSLVAPALMLPMMFKFGSEKGRIAYMIVIGAFTGMMTFLSMEEIQTSVLVLDKMEFWMPMAFAAVVFGLSWLISIRVYEKREL